MPPLPGLVQSTRRTIPTPPPAEDDARTRALAPGVLEAAGGGAPPVLAPAPTILQFILEPQQQTDWCWAAVSASVSRYYGPMDAWEQCTVVNAAFARNDCCFAPGSPACNRPYVLDRPLAVVGKLSYAFLGVMPYPGVEGEVGRGRPVACRIGWYQGGGHFVVLYGFSAADGGEWVYVSDPWWGTAVYPYGGFATAYRNAGSWTHTYLTQP